MKIITFLREKLEEHLPPNSLRRRFAKGASWSLAGAGILQGSALLSLVVAARILGKVGFGELGMIYSTVGMFGIFAGLGLGLTATKHVAEYRSEQPDRAGRIICLSSIVALVSGGIITILLLIISPYLARYTINAPHLTTELQIGCGLLLFHAVLGAQNGVLAGLEAFKAIALVNLFQGFLQLLLVVSGVYLLGLRGAILGMVISVAAGCAISKITLHREILKARIPISYRHILQEWSILWKFSLPAFLSSAMVGPVIWGTRALLVNQPNGYAEMGIFSAAMRFNVMLTSVGTTVGAALLPILTTKEGASSDRFKRGNILISWLIGIVPAIPLICFPEIQGIIFGSEFLGVSGKRTLVLVMCFTCIMIYYQGLARVLAANNMLWWGLLNNIVWAAILLSSAFWMVQWGAVGLAVSFVLAYILYIVAFLPLYIRRKLVPKGTIISPEAIIIWAIIALLAGLSLMGISAWIRGVSLALLLIPLYVAGKRLHNG